MEVIPSTGILRLQPQTWSSQTELIASFEKVIRFLHLRPLQERSTNASVSANRSLEINGLQLFVATEVGGQTAVPDEWAKKVPRP